MAGDELGFVDYLKAAWRLKPTVPLLGKMPVHQLGLAGFAVLGLANPGFWFLGLALETAYLMGLASSDRFQSLVRAERQQAHKQTFETKVATAVARLSAASQERYRRLLAQSRQILGLSEKLDVDQLLSVRGVRAGGLNQLLWIFLRLLASREVLNETLSRVDRDALEAEIAKIAARITEEEAADSESALVRSLRGTLDIQQKRLDNFERAQRSRQVLEAELERIEQQVVLIREEAAVSGKTELLSSRLDAVTGTLTETNRWMEQNAELFGSLGADPLGSTPQELPDIPPPLELEP